MRVDGGQQGGKIDEVEALRLARNYVLQHGPDCWESMFSIRREDGDFHITTSADTLGGNARLVIDGVTGEVKEADWNPM